MTFGVVYCTYKQLQCKNLVLLRELYAKHEGIFIYLALLHGYKNIQFYNNLKIHKLNHAEGPLATSASRSTVSIKKIK